MFYAWEVCDKEQSAICSKYFTFGHIRLVFQIYYQLNEQYFLITQTSLIKFCITPIK
jgi:hypothetical protein